MLMLAVRFCVDRAATTVRDVRSDTAADAAARLPIGGGRREKAFAAAASTAISSTISRVAMAGGEMAAKAQE